ncbi:MAG: hypothetical protein IT365_08300 [Candidatus Hydrogenedentes bacterium]|nr:hypothetical protein [Candidatus Hydrogenedentota bacterium]
MEPILQHLQANWAAYALCAAIILPLVYVTRKWSLPILQWFVELCIYGAIFHVILHYIVAVAEWFQFESQMKMLKDERVREGWQTPLVEFWKQELYKPGWILWLEVVFMVVILYLMYRLRPMKTQRLLAKREQLRKGQAPQVRPPGPSVRQKGR